MGRRHEPKVDAMKESEPMNDQKRKNASQRIKQLLRKNQEDRAEFLEQMDYLQRVVSQMIPLLPKQTVTNILEAAKQPTTKGETDGQKQNKLRHCPEQGPGTAGRQGTLCRHAQA